MDNGWINSAMLKPEENVGVLCFIPEEDNHVTTGMWDVSKKWVLLDDYRVPTAKVTFWRPIDYDLPTDKSFTKTFVEIPPKRKLIAYCGSIRVALDAFKKAEYDALMRGDIALMPCCMFVDIQREYGAESDYKQKADELHKRKIDICDEVFVLNVGGYIGESTRSEIDYATSIGKPVLYLEPIFNQPQSEGFQNT